MEVWTGLAAVARDRRSLASWLGLDAESTSAMFDLALASMRTGRHEQAVRMMRALVSLDRRCPLFRTYLGVALERADDTEGALAAYDAGIEALAGRVSDSDPELAEAHLLRARLRARLGDLDGARADLRCTGAATGPAWQRAASRLAAYLGEAE